MKKWLKRLIPIGIAFIVVLCAFTGQANAAMVFHCGWETGSVSAEWTGVSGSPTVVTIGGVDGVDDPNTGSYCMRCNTSSGTADVLITLSYMQQISFYLYIADTPDVDCVIWGGGVALKLTSTREIDLYDDDADETTDGTTQLDENTWYRISLACETSGNTASVWIDGVLEHDGISVTSGETYPHIGVLTAATADLYFDDVACSTTDSIADLGDIRVINAVPITNGYHQSSFRDAGDSLITWDDVDEVTASTDDYAWYECNGILARVTWTSDTIANLIGSIDSVQAISSWFYYETGGGGSTNEYFTCVRDNGTSYEVSIDDPRDPTWVNRYDATMPNGGGSWTEARADAFNFGMATDDANKDIWCYAAYKMIAYIPSGGCSENISNSPGSWSVNSGNPVSEGGTYNTGLTFFEVSNSSGGPVDISIRGTDLTGGGYTWTLSDTATAGNMTYGLKAGLSGGSYNIIVKKNSPYNDLKTNLADSASQQWGLEIYIPTSYTNENNAKSGTATITATCS